MSSVDTSPRDVNAVIARYKAIGLFGGLFLGAIVGVMIIGPNLRDWWWARSLATFLGAASLGSIAGYFAGELALGGAGAGPGSALSTDGEGHSHTPGLDASGDFGGGGSSGDGGGGGDH